ncbi:hypothetical protein PBY51_009285 [Eleginops maclovinus]|uniref:Uncharacterized protein n=1 Tax=Eleginops maclovinus TaxID=56733 RepID=A0AAN7XWF8_ELEMC|nr:hypothetical protein PBY51_009285 [Eleginops maclovinus]
MYIVSKEAQGLLRFCRECLQPGKSRFPRLSTPKPPDSVMRDPGHTSSCRMRSVGSCPSQASQWELTSGNVIATLSYYVNAASANAGRTACSQWLPFRLQRAVKHRSCDAIYAFTAF